MAWQFPIEGTLSLDGQDYHLADLKKFEDIAGLRNPPVSIRILLENSLRRHLLGTVTAEEILTTARALGDHRRLAELTFMPARVLLQDASGIPALADLAAMRNAMEHLGRPAKHIEPVIPCTLVVDHSVQVDASGTEAAFAENLALEYRRNRERYELLRWAQQAFDNLSVVPPAKGIVHQINLEYLARVVTIRRVADTTWIFPDTLFGTDSHTTMVNALGVLGWGVGGIEAECAMLGEPTSLRIPEVMGVKLTGRMPEGATATDLVLTLTKILRSCGVVGKFVEFYGEGLDHLPLADRATISNMSPEYGSTCAFFPIDSETIRYLRLTGRDDSSIALTEAYARRQGLWRDAATKVPDFDIDIEIDLASVQPCVAGPFLPQDYVAINSVRNSYQAAAKRLRSRPQASDARPSGKAPAVWPSQAATTTAGPDTQADGALVDGAVVIAAITSCTNTSNPAVMLAAGLLARNAASKGLHPKPWVKTSLAPGSRVVTKYLSQADLTRYLDALGFYLVGYGCTTCVGNSGALLQGVGEQIRSKGLIVASVLSGNRNFSGRIHSLTQLNYLASPPLVVAYALAGTLDIDLTSEPLGKDGQGRDVYLHDIWPSSDEVSALTASVVSAEMFRSNYDNLYEGDAHWAAIEFTHGATFPWRRDSSYFKKPPYFDDFRIESGDPDEIVSARCLAVFGDSVTTDHISPIGTIDSKSPAARFLRSCGVQDRDFNSYGSRRGNHEVMVRGTFANIRIRNLMLDGSEGGSTIHVPTAEPMSIFDAAARYGQDGTPLIILAGSQYGTGSARDWAAKGTMLLGVRAVIAKSFERIHRTNLIGMGVLPLQFLDGQDAATLGLTGWESFDIEGLRGGLASEVTVVARGPSGPRRFGAHVMLQTSKDRAYYRSGGILKFILRTICSSETR